MTLYNSVFELDLWCVINRLPIICHCVGNIYISYFTMIYLLFNQIIIFNKCNPSVRLLVYMNHMYYVTFHFLRYNSIKATRVDAKTGYSFIYIYIYVYEIVITINIWYDIAVETHLCASSIAIYRNSHVTHLSLVEAHLIIFIINCWVTVDTVLNI